MSEDPRVYYVTFVEGGRITSVRSGATSNIIHNLKPGETALICGPGADDALHMVVEGEIADRPALAVSDVTLTVGGGEQVVATGLPAGTVVYVDGEDMGTVDDGALALDPHEPVMLSVFLLPPFPHQEARFTVTAA